jgi:hypothetical protein
MFLWVEQTQLGGSLWGQLMWLQSGGGWDCSPLKAPLAGHPGCPDGSFYEW